MNPDEPEEITQSEAAAEVVTSSPYEVTKEVTPYSNSRFKVREIVYKTKAKEIRKTWKIELPGDLIVLIPRFQDKLVLIEEISPPNLGPTWTFPIGFIVSGMPVGDTAQAVLTEKTGMVAHNFAYLGQLSPSRYIKNRAHIMAADGIRRLKGSEAPKNRVSLFTEQQLGSLLINRDLDDGLALASYAYYVTSNYFAEVHGAPNDPNRRTQVEGQLR